MLAEIVAKPDRTTHQMANILQRAAMRDGEIVGVPEKLALLGIRPRRSPAAALPRDRLNAAHAVAEKEQTPAQASLP